MWRKVEEIVVYKDPLFYSAFPSAVTLPDGEVLVVFRRAPDPRAMLGPNAPEKLRGWASHVNERSHQAMVRLDGRTLKAKGPAETMPMNPLAADQDSSMLLTRSGRIVFGAFSWYGFQPPFVEEIKPQVFGLHGGPQNDGLYFGFFGGFTRLSDDGGRTWTEHNYLPPFAGSAPPSPPTGGGISSHDIPSNGISRFSRRGGAVRGRIIEAGDEILLPSYASKNVDARSAAHCYASRDGGKTWEYRALVAHDPEGKVAMGEPALHRCPSGKIACFLRTAGLGDHLVTTESMDNGRTWSAWKQQEVIGHPYNPVALPGGGVLLVYGYRHAPFGIRARVLDDECTDFSGPEIILRDDGKGTDLGYPWANVLPDGRVLVTYYIWGADGVRYIGGTVLARE